MSNNFFIVGSGRSGTTLLQGILMSIEGIYIPPETKFFGQAKRFVNIYGSFKNKKTKVGFLERYIAFCEKENIPISKELLKENFLKLESERIVDYFKLFLNNVKKTKQSRRIGEKTPFHLNYGEDILDNIEESKIIAIVRDPRDVVLGQKEVFGLDILLASLIWRRDQRKINKLKDKYGDEKVLLIKYEDLIGDLENYVKKICVFLEENFDKKILEFYKRSESGFSKREKHKEMTLNPIVKTRIGRYRNELTDKEIGAIELICRKYLLKNNYKLEEKRKINFLTFFYIIFNFPKTLLIYIKRFLVSYLKLIKS